MTPRRNASGLAVAALVILLPSGVTAQEELEPTRPARADTAPEVPAERGADTVRLPGVQLGYEPPALTVALMFGVPGSSDAQHQPVEAVLSLPDAPAPDTALLSRNLTLQGGLVAGAQASLNLASGWGLRLGASYATATLTPALDGEDALFGDSVDVVPDQSAALEIGRIEATVRYWIPSSKRMRPFAELGAAASRWTGSGSLPEATGLKAGLTRWEAVVGVGGVVPLSDRFSAHFRASRRLLRAPVARRAVGDTLVDTGTLLLTAREPVTTSFADGARDVLGLTQLELGLSVTVWKRRPTPEPEPAAEGAGSLSPPGR